MLRIAEGPTANTVTFRIPRSYLGDAKIVAPYDVFALTSYRSPTHMWTVVADDRAPDGAGARSLLDPVVLERPGGNTFTVTDSTLGETGGAGHQFALPVPEESTVELMLAWPDASDLDMYVTGAAQGSAATVGQPERLVLDDVQGTLKIRIDPYLVLGVPSTTYMLQATVVPDSTGGGTPVDTDGDGVTDDADACPAVLGTGSTGCKVPSDETVRVYVDAHEITTVWTQDAEVLATDVRTVVHTAPGADRDSDGVPDSTDNCVRQPNADEADLDNDGGGDVCDHDIDGDGHSNAKESAHGADPYDATSSPGRKKDRGALV